MSGQQSNNWVEQVMRAKNITESRSYGYLSLTVCTHGDDDASPWFVRSNSINKIYNDESSILNLS